MWTLKRKARSGANGATAVADRPTHNDRDSSDEQLRGEIERLTVANRTRPDGDTERRLLELRNLLGVRLLEADDGDPEHPQPEYDRLPSGAALHEIQAADVSAELIRAGILRGGCLLVRGLASRERAQQFADNIDRSFAERERHDSGEPHNDRYYSEFRPDARYGEELARPWIKQGGGVLAVDSPDLSYEMFEIFQASGLPQLVARYLGEPPLITAQKTTLRKAEPSVPGAWHQDGKFMGPVRALNLWLSLSRCGDESPGLDIVPRRFDHHVTTQTDEMLIDYGVSQRVAEEVAGDTPIMRPIFEPGDALFFDELFLHKTGSDPSMPKPRFALENWFFGGSAFPAEYAPLAV